MTRHIKDRNFDAKNKCKFFYSWLVRTSQRVNMTIDESKSISCSRGSIFVGSWKHELFLPIFTMPEIGEKNLNTKVDRRKDLLIGETFNFYVHEVWLPWPIAFAWMILIYSIHVTNYKFIYFTLYALCSVRVLQNRILLRLTYCRIYVQCTLNYRFQLKMSVLHTWLTIYVCIWDLISCRGYGSWNHILPMRFHVRYSFAICLLFYRFYSC